MMNMYENKDYASLSDKVYRHLRDGIIEGRYKTGDCLVEIKIGEELGVSRTPVREALKQLELEDLVTSLPNRGMLVKGFAPEDYRDAYTIRHLLEGQAAFWAAERINREQLDRLAETIELLDLYTRKNDAEHLARLDNAFHEIIYEAAGSRTLKHVLASLHHNTHLARQSSLTMPERAQKSLLEHKNIYAAIEAHDANAAKAYMEQHIAIASDQKTST